MKKKKQNFYDSEEPIKNYYRNYFTRMLKQANFAIYLILFGSLLSISFFFTKEISKVTTNTPLKKDME
jgi:hypothetical protein